jgi:hypothetical protein
LAALLTGILNCRSSHTTSSLSKFLLRISVPFILLFIDHIVDGQNYPFREYGVLDGLSQSQASEINDLEEDGKPSGTEVLISIPHDYHFEYMERVRQISVPTDETRNI